MNGWRFCNISEMILHFSENTDHQEQSNMQNVGHQLYNHLRKHLSEYGRAEFTQVLA